MGFRISEKHEKIQNGLLKSERRLILLRVRRPFIYRSHNIHGSCSLPPTMIFNAADLGKPFRHITVPNQD